MRKGTRDNDGSKIKNKAGTEKKRNQQKVDASDFNEYRFTFELFKI